MFGEAMHFIGIVDVSINLKAFVYEIIFAKNCLSRKYENKGYDKGRQ